MYIRALSPESTGCRGSLAPLISSGSPGSDGGGDTCPSPVFSSLSSLTSLSKAAASYAKTNVVNGQDVFAPLQKVQNVSFLPKVESKCWSASNCSTDSINEVVEDEDLRVGSPVVCRKDVRLGDIGSLHQPDLTSSLRHNWSNSSSTDSINQDDYAVEQRKFVLHEFEGAGSFPRYQQPSSSSLVLRKWSASSFSYDSIDPGEEEKDIPAFSFGQSTGRARFKGSVGSLHEKWSASECSLDSIKDAEEGNYETGSQFPPLIEAARLKETISLSPPNLVHRNHKERSALSSSSSSIGNRSEDSSGSVESDVDSPGDMEVESTLRRGQLNLSVLESALPIKRGLSNFWNGKAKSFASFQDVSSLADLAKPDNPYNKRSRFSSGGRNRPSPPGPSRQSAGISKRTPSGNPKSCLAVAMAMENKLENEPKCLSPRSALRNAQRSFSLSDLEQHGSHTRATPPGTMTRMKGS